MAEAPALLPTAELVEVLACCSREVLRSAVTKLEGWECSPKLRMIYVTAETCSSFQTAVCLLAWVEEDPGLRKPAMQAVLRTVGLMDTFAQPQRAISVRCVCSDGMQGKEFDEELNAKMHERFFGSSDVAGRLRLVVLTGPSGAGKSAVAAQFAFMHREKYSSVFWLQAGSAAALEAGLCAVGRVLAPPQRSQRPLLDARREAKQALRALLLQRRIIPGCTLPWMLVLDGADDEDALKGLFPEERKLPREQRGGVGVGERENGHVLVTSRVRSCARYWQTASCLSVPLLRRSEAVLLLQRAVAGSNEEVEAAAALLGDLRLSLMIACALVRGNRRIYEPEPTVEFFESAVPGLGSWSAFVEEYRERYGELSSRGVFDCIAAGTACSIATLVGLSLAALSPLGTQLLFFCSLLDHVAPIPLHLLSFVDSGHSEECGSGALEAVKGVLELLQLRLTVRCTGVPGVAVRVPGLVRVVVRDGFVLGCHDARASEHVEPALSLLQSTLAAVLRALEACIQREAAEAAAAVEPHAVRVLGVAQSWLRAELCRDAAALRHHARLLSALAEAAVALARCVAVFDSAVYRQYGRGLMAAECGVQIARAVCGADSELACVAVGELTRSRHQYTNFYERA